MFMIYKEKIKFKHPHSEAWKGKGNGLSLHHKPHSPMVLSRSSCVPAAFAGRGQSHSCLARALFQQPFVLFVGKSLLGK